MTINLDKGTKALLAVAGIAILGLYVWSKRKKVSFAGRIPYSVVQSGPNAGQIIFFGPRGNVYLPAGTIPFQQGGVWYYQVGQDQYPLTGVGAFNQGDVNNTLPSL